MSAFFILARRRALSTRNTLAFYTRGEWARQLLFIWIGVSLLYGLYCGFLRMLLYLKTVPLISELLVWKLTAMLLLTTFTMTSLSSLLTSLTTLFYSFDLKFLMKAPVPPRVVFLEKSLESAFFASWMIALVLVPYMAALMKANGYPWAFFAAFVLLTPFFLLLASSLGVAFTLVLLYFFPSSRTRDVIWVLSSLSMTVLYGMLRLARPERLVRPDALRAVTDYLRFLEAPTAPYLPSWWLTKALMSASAARYEQALAYGALSAGAAVAVYAALVALAGRLYFDGYSGAQEAPLRRRLLAFTPIKDILLWKERVTFFRDVKHWSQILLVTGLIFVYLFSIHRLPIDSADLRSLMSFLNIGTAGFVLAALGLRFTFPSISLEGRSWWVLACAPVSPERVMLRKAMFSAVPMTGLALLLGAAANRLLHADPFTSRVSLVALAALALTLCAMGVGLGAVFPMFHVENIHQIESSLGGFVYMAASLFYIGGTIAILAVPMNMHFQERFGKAGAWNAGLAVVCFGGWAVFTAASAGVPWLLGRRSLRRLEV